MADFQYYRSVFVERKRIGMFGSHFVTDEDNEMEWYHVRTEKSGI
jgi:hypothetical protein